MVKKYLKGSFVYVFYRRLKNFNKTDRDEFVRKFYGDYAPADIKSIKRALKWSFLIGGVRYKEFWMRSFEKKGLSEKKQFVPRSAELNLYYQVNPREKYAELLEDKMSCYEFFKPYYKREMVYIKRENDSISFTDKDFFNRHTKFVVKPMGLSGGYGFRIIDTTKDVFPLEEMLEKYPRGLVAEEFIVQKEEMAQFHKESVNCVRVNTVNFGDRIEIKWPFFKMGRGQSIVDNGCAGGIFAVIDVNSGMTMKAADERRNTYTNHPDTGLRILDFKIPEWSVLCDMAIELAKKCPDCHIMGWDMAYTEKGWVVVECNYGPNLIYQYVCEKGFNKDFQNVRKRLSAQRFKGYNKPWQF